MRQTLMLTMLMLDIERQVGSQAEEIEAGDGRTLLSCGCGASAKAKRLEITTNAKRGTDARRSEVSSCLERYINLLKLLRVNALAAT